MRVAFLSKFPQELKIDHSIPINDRIAGSNHEYLSKGIRLMNWKIKLGYDVDDFCENLITVVCEAKAIKIPRIIKNVLLKKHQFK